MSNPQDYTTQVLLHKQSVRTGLHRIIEILQNRALNHDDSKLQEPEFSGFQSFSSILNKLEYGSEEYKENLKNMQPILDHHYKFNSHHPENKANGIDGMTLIDLMEMVADWKSAAYLYGKGGDLEKSLLLNKERFKISDQLYEILRNTCIELGWI